MKPIAQKARNLKRFSILMEAFGEDEKEMAHISCRLASDFIEGNSWEWFVLARNYYKALSLRYVVIEEEWE
jgi:hypothetical protein